jgi:hypothetical protein
MELCILQSNIDTWVESMVHKPLGIRWSQRYAGGVHWSQKTKHTEMEAPMRALMAIQTTTLCQGSVMSLSKNKPSDHFATAIPITANVCPIASNKMAFAKSSGFGISNMFWPKP